MSRRGAWIDGPAYDTVGQREAYTKIIQLGTREKIARCTAFLAPDDFHKAAR